MPKITVFTPTYNRKLTLPKLYDSLCRQTNQDFLWFVVDDGSNDETDKLVAQWNDEKKIKIVFFRQENKGKMNAHNFAVKNSDTEFFLCVDSDDFLEEYAIDDIIKALNKIKDSHFAGLIAARKMIGGNNEVEKFYALGPESTIGSLYERGFRGETSIIFKTSILKQFLFPEISGEKFVTEKYVYDQIDQHFVFLLMPRFLVDCEYFNDGYTKNLKNISIRNPKGFALYYNQSLKLFKFNLKRKILYTMLYIAYSKLGGGKKIYRNCNCKSFGIYVIALFLSNFYLIQLMKR